MRHLLPAAVLLLALPVEAQRDPTPVSGLDLGSTRIATPVSGLDLGSNRVVATLTLGAEQAAALRRHPSARALLRLSGTTGRTKPGVLLVAAVPPGATSADCTAPGANCRVVENRAGGRSLRIGGD